MENSIKIDPIPSLDSFNAREEEITFYKYDKEIEKIIREEAEKQRIEKKVKEVITTSMPQLKDNIVLNINIDEDDFEDFEFIEEE